jgi:predicted enzyme related to lactoylglutathione lyase
MLFILYIADQKRSREFYKHLLKQNPSIDEPRMTEFAFKDGSALGLMPEKGAARILGSGVPNPAGGRGIPRCEIYLRVENPKLYLNRALAAGAKLLSPLQSRG